MSPTKTISQAALALFGFALAFALVSDAFAQTVRVRCEVRDDRSRASIDGNDLAPLNGDFQALLQSGSSTAMSGVQMALGDEAQFGFASNPNDIAAGATAIAPDFIQGAPPAVTATIFNAATNQPVISATVSCEDKR